MGTKSCGHIGCGTTCGKRDVSTSTGGQWEGNDVGFLYHTSWGPIGGWRPLSGTEGRHLLEAEGVAPLLVMEGCCLSQG